MPKLFYAQDPRNLGVYAELSDPELLIDCDSTAQHIYLQSSK